MGYTRIVHIYYWFSLTSRCYFYLPIIVLWFLSQGFTQFQVMILLNVYFLSIMIAELPTGIFADHYGRKWAMAAGSVAQTAGVLFLVVPAQWPLTVAGEALLGLGYAFHMGAKEAFLYDHLKAVDAADQYQRIYAKSKFYEFLAMSVGSVCGAPLYLLGGPWPFLASAVIFSISIVLAVVVAEPPHAKQVKVTHLSTLRLGWREISQGPGALKRLTAYYAWFFTFILIIVVALSQPYLRSVGIDVKYFGWIFLGYHMLSMAGSLLAEQIPHRDLGRRFFLILGALFIAASVVLGVWRHPLAFLVMGLIYLGWGLLLPTTSHVINAMVASERRATVLSIQSFLQNLSFVVMALVVGSLVDYSGMELALMALALVSVVILLVSMGRYYPSKPSPVVSRRFKPNTDD